MKKRCGTRKVFLESGVAFPSPLSSFDETLLSPCVLPRSQHFMVMPYEIEPRTQEFTAQLSVAEYELTAAVGHLSYLKNLSTEHAGRTVVEGSPSSSNTEDLCLICQEPKSNQVVLLPCGHSFW
jgi:hypothetical protein